MHLIRAAASALVPGLGQVFAARWLEALLFTYAMLWVRLFLTGQAPPDDRLITFFFGAPAIDGGLGKPVLVVFTGLLIALHALAAWHATGGTKGSGEVDADLAP